MQVRSSSFQRTKNPAQRAPIYLCINPQRYAVGQHYLDQPLKPRQTRRFRWSSQFHWYAIGRLKARGRIGDLNLGKGRCRSCRRCDLGAQ
jgi:hypothetical protein